MERQSPHGDECHVERETGVPGGAQGVDHHQIEGTVGFQNEAYQEQLRHLGDDVGVIGEQADDGAVVEGRQQGDEGGDDEPQLQAFEQLAVGLLEAASLPGGR